MAERNMNPFDDEKPQIVHLEKNDSHYEYCRMQMHDIEKVHRRTFFCNMFLCILVCFFSIFKKYIAVFDLFSRPFISLDKPQALLTGGIFQIMFGMAIILLGYLAWANYHTLNIILWAWYMMVMLFGVFRLDYLSAVIGVIGAVFYFFSISELRREQALSQMEGYPDFHEKFDISKSDIVIQTLRAHQGERRTKSTLFTTDYSLRRKKKKNAFAEEHTAETGTALADALQNSLNNARNQEEQQPAADAAPETAEKMTAAADGMEDLIADAAENTEVKAESIEPERANAEAAAAALLAEAEARTQKQLSETEKKPNAKKKQHR